MSNSIKIAIIGLGNCASSLIQGIDHYRNPIHLKNAIGLMNPFIGPYQPKDIDVVAAYDIDQRKVGQQINEAIFAKPNCTTVFQSELHPRNVIVSMGPVLDGVASQHADYPDDQRFIISDAAQPDMDTVVKHLKHSGAEIMMNYLPVGSQQATEFYAECALKAGLAFVNNIPVFIASNPTWAQRFVDHRLPIIGDDIKAQLGATITHRTLMELFNMRGVKVNRSYQLNTGGNTDFLNMLDRKRLLSKKISKTKAVESLAKAPMGNNIHVGPSDYVPWQQDNKIAYIRLEGELFGGVPMNLECRLSVEDSPNSAGIAIDSIRIAKLALNNQLSGPITGPSAFFCKHPPTPMTDQAAHAATQAFIATYSPAKEKELQT